MSNFRGPLTSMGALEVDSSGTTAAPQPFDGPAISYQGLAAPDLRASPFNKDAIRPGAQPAFLFGADFFVLDVIPQARSSTSIAAAQIVTSAVAVSLVTAQPAGAASAANIAVGVPIVPIGTTVATFAAIAIDFGFTTGTTVSGGSTVTVVDSTLFHVGQWIVIAGAGNSSASRSLVTQVQSIIPTTNTGITVSPSPATTLLNVPIGQGNLFGSGLLPSATQFGPAAASASGHSFGGAFADGLARIYNPKEMSARALSVTSVTAIQSAYSAVVSGWDVYGNPMTEVLSNVVTVTTYVGRKAFKYISSITSGTTVAGSQGVAFGLSDTFGLPIRADYWEEVTASWNGVGMANFSGFVAGLTGTTVANSTTDVRGSLVISTAIITGALATAMSVIASNGTGRLAVSMNITPMSVMYGSPVNTLPIFGQSQYTATS